MYLHDGETKPLPQWIDHQGQTWLAEALAPETLESLGWLPLVHETEDAPLGYADPVVEIRDGRQVAAQYALGTPEERAAEILRLAKLAKREAVNARRTQAETSGFMFGGHPMDSDRDAILRISNGALAAISSLMAQQGWGTVWRCMDNVDVPLDANGMLLLQATLALHGQACHTQACALKAEIDAATDLTDLAMIDIEAGWPTLD